MHAPVHEPINTELFLKLQIHNNPIKKSTKLTFNEPKEGS